MARITVNGMGFHVEERGEGSPPLFFVHGLACDYRSWTPQIDDLSRDHRCIAVDLRGCGQSDAAPPYNLTTLTDDVAAVIREMGLPPAVLIGHSLGGLLVLTMNWRHPDLVLGTVLADTRVHGGTALLSSHAEALRKAGSSAPWEAVVERSLAETTPAEVQRYVQEVMLSCPFEVLLGMAEDLGEWATRPEDIIKATGRKPILALWAGTGGKSADMIGAHAPSARQEVVRDTRHFFMLEEPDTVNELIRGFLHDPSLHAELARI